MGAYLGLTLYPGLTVGQKIGFIEVRVRYIISHDS